MRRRRNRLTAASITAALALLIIVGGGALATSTSTIVAPGGRVEGRTYAQWLVKAWQVRLAKPPSASLCQRVGQVEVILYIPGPRRRHETHNCTVSGDHALYVSGWGVECSTIEKPPFHGETPAELKRCARRVTERAFSDVRWEIDGKAVRHLGSFVRATSVFRFHMPRHNILGLNKRSGRAAAYGAGLLLRGLAEGRHIVHRSLRVYGSQYETTFRVDVHG